MSARRLLQERQCRRFFAAQTLSLLGDSALWLACGIWVKTLTGSNSAAALTFLCFTAPALLAPAAGLLVDRLPHRPLLIAADLAGAAILTPLLLVHDRGDVWLIYAVMALYGLLNIVIAPAQSALLTVLLPPSLLPDANALLRTVQQGLRILAPLAGAGLFTLLGGHAVALLDMLTFLAAAVLLRPCAPLARPDATGRATARPDKRISAGFRFLLSTPPLRRLTLAAAIATLAFGTGEATVYAIIDRALHRPPQFAGVTQTLQGLGAIAGGLLTAAAIRRRGELHTITAGLALLAAATLLLSTPWPLPVLTGMLLAGAALTSIVIALITLLQRQAPHHLQGRVYAAFELCATAPQTAGLAAGAALITALDYRLLLLAAATGLLLATALLATRQRTPARRPT
ncbi:MFS transporter [Dactylosporangium vinaceum]|uniref:MFS transporter n=1 Tax=Dactylosporangium vinaceum TaxID=53362 RepID=A0ABV5M8G9_9ACTN|nr:MFS transporter [Dactylosporangium vinaceum]UAB94196.1 MFS transporter [Dactylosporangium vinaceum]